MTKFYLILTLFVMMMAATANAQVSIEADGSFEPVANACPADAILDATSKTCSCETGHRAVISVDGSQVLCPAEPVIDADGMFTMPSCPGQCPDNSHANVAGDKCACDPGHQPRIIPTDANELTVICHEEFVFGEARAARAVAGQARRETRELDKKVEDYWSQFDQFRGDIVPRVEAVEQTSTDNAATLREHSDLIQANADGVADGVVYDDAQDNYAMDTRATANAAHTKAQAVARYVNSIGRPVAGLVVGGGMLNDIADMREVTLEGSTDLIPVTMPAAPILEFGGYFGVLNNGANRGGLLQLTANISPTSRNNTITGEMEEAKGFGFGGTITGGYISAPMRHDMRGFVGLSVSGRRIDMRWTTSYLASRFAVGPVVKLWAPFSPKSGVVFSAAVRPGTLTMTGADGDPSSFAMELVFSANFFTGGGF